MSWSKVMGIQMFASEPPQGNAQDILGPRGDAEHPPQLGAQPRHVPRQSPSPPRPHLENIHQIRLGFASKNAIGGVFFFGGGEGGEFTGEKN